MMAERPVFIVAPTGPVFVQTIYVPFEWAPGMAVVQKQKNIASLHSATLTRLGIDRILEVSSKSKDGLGKALSAFNLAFVTIKQQRVLRVESAYQGSKVFERGGPYVDLYERPSKEAKTDLRLQSSGRLLGFRFFGTDWSLEPQTAFYDWLYINALYRNPTLAEKLPEYLGFTDIEFNPKRSFNCQAYSCALYVALQNRGLVELATSSKAAFLQVMANATVSNARQDETAQPRFRL
jgi:hypothetical protein